MKILLFYFSGTGNTKAVTELLSDGFASNDIQVTTFNITDSYQKLSIDDFDIIGIGYPVYAFSAPKNVVSWLKGLNMQKKKIFLYNTSGGYSKLNNAASNKLIKILKKNDNNVFYDRTIVMPSNWYIKYDDRLSKQLYFTAQKKVEHMIDDVINQKQRFNKPNFFIKTLAYSSYFFEGKLGARLFSKTLYANGNCNRCKLWERTVL